MYGIILFTIIGIVLEKELVAEKRNYTVGIDHVLNAERFQENDVEFSTCFVSVVVHNSSSLKYGLQNALVTAISGPLASSINVVAKYSEGLTDSSGRSCLPIMCREEVHIFVEKYSERIQSVDDTNQKTSLPPDFFFIIGQNNEVIQFYSFSVDKVSGKTGPVYGASEKQTCLSALDNFHFAFAYIATPDVLSSTPKPTTDINVPLDPYAWHYGLDGSSTPKRTCYLKIKMKTTSTHAKIRAYSRLDNQTGPILGLFETGPQYDVNAGDITVKAACVEFRCPASLVTPPFTDMKTYLEGNIEVPGRDNGCCVRTSDTSLFHVGPLNFYTTQPLTPSDNYGSDKGIYIHEDHIIARAKCFTGREFLGSEYAMNVSTGFAFEYDCVLNNLCGADTIVG